MKNSEWKIPRCGRLRARSGMKQFNREIRKTRENEDRKTHFDAGSKPFFNPERIESFSPRLARFREGLPWVVVIDFCNPEGVAPGPMQPFQGCDGIACFPGVARSSQPRAE